MAKPRKPARTITHDGQTRTIQEWSKATGLGESLIHYRLSKGLTPSEVLAPKGPSGRPRRDAPPAAAAAARAPRPRRAAVETNDPNRHPALELLEAAGYTVHRSLEVPSGLMLVVGAAK